MLSPVFPRVDNDVVLGILPFYHIYGEITQARYPHSYPTRGQVLLIFFISLSKMALRSQLCNALTPSNFALTSSGIKYSVPSLYHQF